MQDSRAAGLCGRPVSGNEKREQTALMTTVDCSDVWLSEIVAGVLFIRHDGGFLTVADAGTAKTTGRAGAKMCFCVHSGWP